MKLILECLVGISCNNNNTRQTEWIFKKDTMIEITKNVNKIFNSNDKQYIINTY